MKIPWCDRRWRPWPEHAVAKLCLWAIEKNYRWKDRVLAEMIHRVAGLPQTRPKEGWKCPEDWRNEG